MSKKSPKNDDKKTPSVNEKALLPARKKMSSWQKIILGSGVAGIIGTGILGLSKGVLSKNQAHNQIATQSITQERITRAIEKNLGLYESWISQFVQTEYTPVNLKENKLRLFLANQKSGVIESSPLECLGFFREDLGIGISLSETKNEQNNTLEKKANVLFHELAHAWVGDKRSPLFKEGYAGPSKEQILEYFENKMKRSEYSEVRKEVLNSYANTAVCYIFAEVKKTQDFLESILEIKKDQPEKYKKFRQSLVSLGVRLEEDLQQKRAEESYLIASIALDNASQSLSVVANKVASISDKTPAGMSRVLDEVDGIVQKYIGSIQLFLEASAAYSLSIDISIEKITESMIAYTNEKIAKLPENKELREDAERLKSSLVRQKNRMNSGETEVDVAAKAVHLLQETSQRWKKKTQKSLDYFFTGEEAFARTMYALGILWTGMPKTDCYTLNNADIDFIESMRINQQPAFGGQVKRYKKVVELISQGMSEENARKYVLDDELAQNRISIKGFLPYEIDKSNK